MLPNFIGIGAPRTGSTWLARNIMLHPEIYVPWAKELHFFDRDFEKGLDFYEAQFDPEKNIKAIGEITPAYIYKPNVPERIYQTLPEVKLICCLRDPVERAYSAYWRGRTDTDNSDSPSFESKLKTIPDLVDAGLYYTHLQKYYSLFPAENIFLFLFEEIEDDSLALLYRIFSFLDVDPNFEPSLATDKINSAASQGSVSRFRPLWQIYRALNRFGIYGMNKTIEKVNRSAIPPMSPETESELRSLYRDEVLGLQELTGLDLRKWAEPV